MEKSFILFIEDESIWRKKITSICESMSNIMITHCDSNESAKEYLKRNRYDLVILDIMIYETEEEKRTISKDSKGNYTRAGNYNCFDSILEITESMNPPIPLIIYTNKQDIYSLENNWSRIVDFWDKNKIDSEFISFRIFKILELVARERSDYNLLNEKIKKMFEKKNIKLELPWAENVTNVLESFNNYVFKNDKLESIKSELRDIANKGNFLESFTLAFDTLRGIDLPIVSLLPNKSTHMTHVIHVFLMGYYILNSLSNEWLTLLLKKNKIFIERFEYYKNTHTEKKNHDELWKEFNYAWFTASLLHDCGLAIQYSKSMIDSIVKANCDMGLTNNVGGLDFRNELTDNLYSGFLRKIEVINSNTQVTQILEKSEKTMNHGLLSAIFIAKYCYEEINKANNSEPNFILMSAEAAALHDLLKKEKDTKISFSEKPILSLLLICDAIQYWDRRRIDFSVIHGGVVDKVEIDKFEINRINKGKHYKIIIALKYYPTAYVAQHKPSMLKAKEKLRDDLTIHVNNFLRDKLIFDFDDEFSLSFQLLFYFGNDEISKCELPN